MKGWFTKNLLKPKRLQMIVPELEKDWSIADLGCGDSWLTNALKKADYNCKGIKWLKYPMHYPDDYFDCSIVIEVVEHLPLKLLDEVERITRKKIILTTILPSTIWIIRIMIALKMIIPLETEHKKEYKLADMPFKKFKLVKKRRHWFIDQFGVFERIKK
jgi:hypothetical protein